MNNDYLGKVVYSKAGRDKENCFIIIDVIDENYVYISDGRLRSIEKPKKKKLKHLSVTKIVSDEIKNDIILKKQVNNATVRNFLQSVCTNKEV
ncbi:KOW domain-containing RNA-binding protein [Clostridium hydrogenum]|uniref:KOW domain-containing RNA-binding protein n=1 Tax=Clostridium hydrogenum TaxID=2855764 RepID=UPI001F442CA5|nr:KOW domain-containing RNA-binding protein [Clostridium hydrogenum]